VYRDGELGGLISFEAWSPVIGSIHCLFKRAFWGQATTDAALGLVYRQLFDSGVLNTVEIVFSDNHAIRALAKRMGAREAGFIRPFTVRDGKPVDGVILQLSKEEFFSHAKFCGAGADRRERDRGRLRQAQDADADDAQLHARADGHAADGGGRAEGLFRQRRGLHTDEERGDRRGQ
jgi:hypothetical protein